MTENDGTAVTDTQSGPTQEYVEIPDASDEDLESFLNDSQEGAPQPEQQATTPEPGQDEMPKQPVAPPPPPAQDNEQVTRAEFERMRKQLEGQELLIKRRTSEIGELKHRLNSFIGTKDQELDELWTVNPRAAHQTQQQIDQAKAAIANLENEEQTLTNVHQAQTLVATHVGPSVDWGAAVEVLREDGMPEEYLQQFVRNPFASALPETLIQLAKRGQERQRAVQAEAALQEIVPIIQQLIAENRTAPNNVARNISNALRQSPSITASNGGRGHPDRTANVNPASMSDAELEEFLRKK